MRRRIHLSAGLTTLALVAALVPATSSAAASRTTPPVPRLVWTDCGPEHPGFRCATAKVPTDYDRPYGATTTIALTKLPATGTKKQRKGSLFTNPGGPGGSGVDFVQTSATTAYSPQVRAAYDVIGFDPRGVGGSDPVTCYADAAAEQAALAGLPAYPVTAADAAAFLPLDAGLSASCRATSGDRISHASTANVARDLDLLRRAVGDRRLTYYGYSYGTYLGATYGRLFPRNVGKMVLDGTLDPAAYSGSDGDTRSVGARTGQGPAAAETFQQFLIRCEQAGTACALNALGKPADVVRSTFEALKKTPVPVPVGDGTTIPIGYPEAVATTFQSMYSPVLWTDLATSLAYLARGGQGELPATAQQQMRRAGEDYVSVGGSLASTCVDTAPGPRPEGYQAQADAEDAKAPDFGRFRSWVGIECETLGVRDTDAYRGPWQQKVKQPVLVIGTRHDPATPYANTAPYTDLFPRGRMLTVEGYGHTILGKSTCADDVVTRYLVGGVTPKRGATCEQSVQPFAPTTPAQERRAAQEVAPLLR